MPLRLPLSYYQSKFLLYRVTSSEKEGGPGLIIARFEASFLADYILEDYQPADPQFYCWSLSKNQFASQLRNRIYSSLQFTADGNPIKQLFPKESHHLLPFTRYSDSDISKTGSSYVLGQIMCYQQPLLRLPQQKQQPIPIFLS